MCVQYGDDFDENYDGPYDGVCQYGTGYGCVYRCDFECDKMCRKYKYMHVGGLKLRNSLAGPRLLRRGHYCEELLNRYGVEEDRGVCGWRFHEASRAPLTPLAREGGGYT